MLQTDLARTRQLHQLYPPCRGKDGGYVNWPVLICFDPVQQDDGQGRWVLCYKATEKVPIGGGHFQVITYPKAFYVWQGPRSTYLAPDVQNIANWCRDHDMFSGGHCGSWEDRHFKQDARIIAAQEAAEEDALCEEFDDMQARGVRDGHIRGERKVRVSMAPRNRTGAGKLIVVSR